MKVSPSFMAAALIVLALGSLWTRTRVQPLGTYDQGFYLGIAYDLVHHDRFTDGYRFAGGGADTDRPSGMRFTPLYPALLAAVASVDPELRRNMDCSVGHEGLGTACGHGAGPMRSLQFLMMAATLWMLWWAAGHCTGRARTGWIALGLGLMTAPLLLLSVDYLMTETISLFLVVGASTLALAAWRSEARRTEWASAAGLVFGLAVLTRPGFSWLGYAVFAVGMSWALAGVLAAGRWDRWRVVGGFAAGAGLVVLPWIVRNAMMFGRASLTFGYGSHTFVQRLSFDGMDWHEYAMSFVCWLPDGNGIGRSFAGAGACDRFGWDDHANSFYSIGIGPMLVDTLRQSGGWANHMSFLVHHYLLRDPLRQLSWHAMVTLPLALRGLYVDHYWGFVLGPVCAVLTVQALRRRNEVDRRFLLLALPAWFMLAFNAAAAVNQVRYNLMLIVPFSIAGAMAIEAALVHLARLRAATRGPQIAL
ncbi:MAG: ArnT family glycosyltransferase [Janthinobacterium lividum]